MFFLVNRFLGEGVVGSRPGEPDTVSASVVVTEPADHKTQSGVHIV